MKNQAKNQGLRRWVVVVVVVLSLVLSPTRAPGGSRAVAEPIARRETAGEVVR